MTTASTTPATTTAATTVATTLATTTGTTHNGTTAATTAATVAQTTSAVPVVNFQLNIPKAVQPYVIEYWPTASMIYNVWEARCEASAGVCTKNRCGHILDCDVLERRRNLGEQSLFPHHVDPVWLHESLCVRGRAVLSHFILGLFPIPAALLFVWCTANVQFCICLECTKQRTAAILASALTLCSAVLFIIATVLFGGGIIAEVKEEWFEGFDHMIPGYSGFLAIIAAFLAVCSSVNNLFLWRSLPPPPTRGVHPTTGSPGENLAGSIGSDSFYGSRPGTAFAVAQAAANLRPGSALDSPSRPGSSLAQIQRSSSGVQRAASSLQRSSSGRSSASPPPT